MSTPKEITNGGPSRNATTTGPIPKGGELHVSIVGVDDLPTRDDPSFVRIQACGETVQSGGPSSRHKTFNSFKFGGPSSDDLVIQSKSLKSLYQSTMKIELVYNVQPARNLTTTYALKQLYVNEEVTLVLELETPKRSGNIGTRTEEVAPTIKLKLQLKGPYRPEIASLVSVAHTWFSFMANVEHSCQRILPSNSNNKFLPVSNKGLLLIPAVPILTTAIVVAPIFLGLCVLFLPVFVPVLVALLTVATCGMGTGLVLYSSTPSGRQTIGPNIEPVLKSMLHTETGQAMVYPTGPRPTPVSVARLILPRGMWGRLAVSLLIDAIGSSSYLVPLLGEGFDLAWAPIQTAIIMAMYDTTTPNLKYVSFVEELLPFTDFVPSATIGWAYQFGPVLLNKKSDNDVVASSTNAQEMIQELALHDEKKEG